MILDTNALSALADGDSDLRPVLAKPSLLALLSTVLGEYLYGVSPSPARVRYETWLAGLIPACLILSVDRGTAVY
jgi:predicted nucleic acid-binding protein